MQVNNYLQKDPANGRLYRPNTGLCKFNPIHVNLLTKANPSTVEPPIKDTPNKGHVSIKDAH